MEWWQLQELLMTVAVIVGVLVPVFALTYRFVLSGSLGDRKPLARGPESTTGAVSDQRLDRMERQLEDLEGMVRRLVDTTEFDRQLKSGKPTDGDD